MRRKILLLLAAVATAVVSYAQESVFTPVDKNLYPNNMTMVIRLTDGDATEETAEVAAFVDGECRGTAHATKGLYYLVISGEGAGQPMTLSICRDGSTYVVDDTQQFASDDNIGTSWEPYVIDLQGKKPVATAMGDVNGDGLVNIVDLTTTISYILATGPQTFIKEAADTNNDGVINIVDVVTIIDIILNGK